MRNKPVAWTKLTCWFPYMRAPGMALLFPVPHGDKFAVATPPHTSPGSGSVGKNHNACNSHSSLLAQKDSSAFTQIYHYDPGNIKRFSNVPIMVPGMMSPLESLGEEKCSHKSEASETEAVDTLRFMS